MDTASYDALWEERLRPFLQEKEAQRRAAVKRFFVSGAIGVGFAILVPIAMAMFEWAPPVIIIAFVALFGGFAAGSTKLTALRREIKRDLLDAIAEAAGMEYRMRPGEPARYDAFRQYGLLPSDNRRSFEDGFLGRVGEAGFFLCEAHLQQRRRTKNRTYYVTVFRGVLITINFPRKVEGVTVITRDNGWFNGLSALGHSMSGSGLKRVGLVDPKFEKIFEVYGDDQVAARYMVTPSFMERLLALETALAGKKVRGAFDANLGEGELLIAAETGNLFEPGSMFKPLDDKTRFQSLLDELRLVTEIIDLLCKPAEFGEAERPPES